MELQEALRQIATIRDAAARAEVFRGYRSLTAGFSAALGVAAAIIQARWIPQPLEEVDRYLYLWCSVAAISIGVTGGELWWRARKLGSSLASRQTWQAVEQFLPCLVAGALVTLAISQHALDAAIVLPGLWATLFSLGLFASLRVLPKTLIFAAVYYLACGVLCICFAQGDAALSPWEMGLTFGVGQAFIAAILYWTLERNDGEA